MGGLESLREWLGARLSLTNFRPVPLTEHAVFAGRVFRKRAPSAASDSADADSDADGQPGGAGCPLEEERELRRSDPRLDRDRLVPLVAEVVAPPAAGPGAAAPGGGAAACCAEAYTTCWGLLRADVGGGEGATLLSFHLLNPALSVLAHRSGDPALAAAAPAPWPRIAGLWAVAAGQVAAPGGALISPPAAAAVVAPLAGGWGSARLAAALGAGCSKAAAAAAAASFLRAFPHAEAWWGEEMAACESAGEAASLAGRARPCAFAGAFAGARIDAQVRTTAASCSLDASWHLRARGSRPCFRCCLTRALFPGRSPGRRRHRRRWRTCWAARWPTWSRRWRWRWTGPWAAAAHLLRSSSAPCSLCTVTPWWRGCGGLRMGRRRVPLGLAVGEGATMHSSHHAPVSSGSEKARE